eukprot:gnl/TRDRNA2_/TRDRNA2_42854_c0_seq1.p1 gnl/TRDRNA2_/TRDRNA2_42854_c0~~gnl/TRDRNA2_/TRDRNA2_42854_c0_seq1.p1  ORF type:complete len:237 (+),score=13.69 gnl/TRDRNA2_/TRDRNA2_42854_c0_seq1:130-840(+)
MPRGVLVRWNTEKGFGFVEPRNGGEDLFVHVSALMDGDGSVREGDSVRFKRKYDEKKGKDRAIDVELADSADREAEDMARDGDDYRPRGGGVVVARRDDCSESDSDTESDCRRDNRGRDRGGRGRRRDDNRDRDDNRYDYRDDSRDVRYRGRARARDRSRSRDRSQSRGYDRSRSRAGQRGRKGGGKGDLVLPGDWECPKCGGNNYSRRTDCFRCGTPKPAEGGRGRRRSRSRSRY